MSLSALPTEIDEIIIQRLPQCALYNLTLTSKYYRELAEPHLYRDIKLHESNLQSITRLFLNLISRRDLSKHIRSFALVSNHEKRAIEDTSDASSDEEDAHYLGENDSDVESPHDPVEKVSEELLRWSMEIKKAIQELADPFHDSNLTLKWYLSALGATQSIDGSLAIILCLATNLEHLQLADVDDGITKAVCRAR